MRCKLRQVSKSEISKLNDALCSQFGLVKFFDRKDRVSFVEKDHILFVLRDGKALFFYHEGRLVPLLNLLLENQFLKVAVVDMGAVKFVVNGADIMRPGIVDIDHSVVKGDFVVVMDETHGKPLAVCEALMSGDLILAQPSGKVLKNLHFVGDKLWEFSAHR